MKKILYVISLVTILAATLSCRKTDTVNPGLSITGHGNVEIPFYAAEAEINYIVERPVDGADVLVDVRDADWIEITDVSVPGTVSFTVSENTEDEPRSVIMTLRYVYAGGEVSAQVNILQDAKGPGDLSASYTLAYYYGGLNGTPGMRYTLYLMENPLRGEYFGVGLNYCLDIYAEAPRDLNAIMPPEGTYVLSDTNEPGTVGIAGTSLINMDDETQIFFSEGTLTITSEGNVYTYVAEMTDEAGVLYKAVYTGEVLFEDASYYSSLTEDYDVQLGGCEAVAAYFGDYYGVGHSNFMLQIMPVNKQGATLQFDLLSPISSNTATGIAEGTYNIEDTAEELTALTGVLEDNTIAGSWLFTVSDGKLQSPMAPFSGGTLEIERDGDIYTFTLNALDDSHERHAVTAVWSGPLRISDMSEQSVRDMSVLLDAGKFCKSFCE